MVSLATKAALVLGPLMFAAGVWMLRPVTSSAAYNIGMRRPDRTVECYRVEVSCPGRVRVDEQFITTATVTAVGWGAKNKPGVALQLSAAGMDIDPRTPLPAAAAAANTHTVRWTVRPQAKGTFRMIFNVTSATHPLEFVGAARDGVFPIEVYAPWTAAINPFTGALFSFLGPLATLPGILGWWRGRRERAAVAHS